MYFRFMHYVIFAHRPRFLKRSAHAALGLAMCAVIPVAGQQTRVTTFRAFEVTSQVATPGAESAVNDWLVSSRGACLLVS